MRIIKRGVKTALRRVGFDISKVRTKGVEVDCYWLRSFLGFTRLYPLIEDVQGDVVECGVGAGSTFFMLACLLESEGKGRALWGFDSFQGFPEPSEHDRSPRNPQKGEWKVAEPADIHTLLRGGGLSAAFIQRHVRIVPGFFDQSFDRFSGDTVAFLHLDVDLYHSYKTCLEYFWPKVAKGGVVVFDEYRQPGALRSFPGASRAIDEFLGHSMSLIQCDKKSDKYYLVKD